MSYYKSYNISSYSNGKYTKNTTGSTQSSYQSQFNNDNIRIIKRNLVYVINLDPLIADKDILTKKEYFGQYGKITKILVNLNKAYNANNSTSGLSYSAYINYSTNQEAALAILAVDSCNLNGKVIKAAFGTTKYCSYYLKKQACPIKDCVYMHSVSDKNDIICKDSADFYIDQHKLAVRISNISEETEKDKLFKTRLDDSVLPNAYSIYSKKNLSYYIKKAKEDKIFEDQTKKQENKSNDSKNKSNLRTIFNREDKKSSEEDNIKSKSDQKDYKKQDISIGLEKDNSLDSSNNPINEEKILINKLYSENDKYYQSCPYDDTSSTKSNNDIKERSISYNIISSTNDKNKRHLLFNIENRPIHSRFRFNTDLSEIERERKLSESTVDEKIIRDYFLKFSFSSSFKFTEKIAIEENYYKSIKDKADEYTNLLM